MPLQNLLCWHKNQFYWMQIIFLSCAKYLWLPQYVNKFLVCHKKFGLAQNILVPVKGRGIREHPLMMSHVFFSFFDPPSPKSSSFYQIYLISGDEKCQCLHWRSCPWSKLAVFSVKDMAEENEEYQQVQTILQKNTCGDDPKNHSVNCCSPNQKSNEIDPLIKGIF